MKWPETQVADDFEHIHKWVEKVEEVSANDGQVNWPVHTRRGAGLSLISVKEHIGAQASDPWCQVLAEEVNEGQKGDSNATILDFFQPYCIGATGSAPGILHLADFQRLSGHWGTTLMYQTLRRESPHRPVAVHITAHLVAKAFWDQ